MASGRKPTVKARSCADGYLEDGSIWKHQRFPKSIYCSDGFGTIEIVFSTWRENILTFGFACAMLKPRFGRTRKTKRWWHKLTIWNTGWKILKAGILGFPPAGRRRSRSGSIQQHNLSNAPLQANAALTRNNRTNNRANIIKIYKYQNIMLKKKPLELHLSKGYKEGKFGSTNRVLAFPSSIIIPHCNMSNKILGPTIHGLFFVFHLKIWISVPRN